MKYFRTKDGRIVKHPHPNAEVFTFRYEILNQADTIEELCDLFVIKGRTFYDVVEKTALDTLLKNYEPEPDIIILGAIWTDEGLIYKTKMKGVLPNGEIDWKLL